MRILFVFHHAGITGAALMLYSTIEWLSRHTDVKMSFLLRDDGPLKNELTKFGKVYEWNVETPKPMSLFSRIKRKMFPSKNAQDVLIDQLENEKFDILYFNTILCSSIIKKLAHFHSKKIWHIHELELAIKTHGANHLDAKGAINKVIANSDSTKKNLVNRGFNGENINVIYPFINRDKIASNSKEFFARKELNIPQDAFVIGTSGATVETKGVQNFLTLPSILDHLMPGNNFYFVWVGTCSYKQKITIEHDIEKAGNNSRVIFTGEQRNPFPYYNSFDVFVSTSKEESFGMSAIEAASLNKPLICFKNTGGIEEIVAGAGNMVIDYMDVYQMVLAIIDLYKNKDKAVTLGNNACAFSEKYDINLVMPRLSTFLRETAANS